eukprot:gnl/MRDRNA2_/MRDRNA2_76850_c0_seq2.p1 gnl/MRDRNA2_/MRDRNA2_76850_c0~~gnl/MRDRNA2_/MRDRNA2_76850_c0_seq2.p1  ORF type:complete len:426 (-),score=79.61 gnl/MRDRNA2_/MRDRNA2_76850_c0_seq2:270-1547(-)
MQVFLPEIVVFDSDGGFHQPGDPQPLFPIGSMDLRWRWDSAHRRIVIDFLIDGKVFGGRWDECIPSKDLRWPSLVPDWTCVGHIDGNATFEYLLTAVVDEIHPFPSIASLDVLKDDDLLDQVDSLGGMENNQTEPQEDNFELREMIKRDDLKLKEVIKSLPKQPAAEYESWFCKDSSVSTVASPADHCDSNKDVESAPHETNIPEEMARLEQMDPWKRAKDALDAIATQLTHATIWNDECAIMDMFELLSVIRVTNNPFQISKQAAWKCSGQLHKALTCSPESLKDSHIDEIVERFKAHPSKAVQAMAQQLTNYWEWTTIATDRVPDAEQEGNFEEQSKLQRRLRYITKRLARQSCWESPPLIEQIFSTLQEIHVAPLAPSMLHRTNMLKVLEIYRMHPNCAIRSMSKRLHAKFEAAGTTRRHSV